jgi:predicted oxidoreductase
VGGPGGEKHHPIWDAHGTYHIDGPLVVTDKVGAKDLTRMLLPLMKALGGVKKLILSPLSHYWQAPSSNAESHLKIKTITCPVYCI